MTQFNEAQHLAMLNEISVAAFRVAEMARMIQLSKGDEIDADVLAAAVALTAQRIGWMADVAAKASLGVLPEAFITDAWNMPAIVIAEAHATTATVGAAP